MKKRILPALLALCMVMSLLPVSVFAEDSETAPVVCVKCGCTDLAELTAKPEGDYTGTKCYYVATTDSDTGKTTYSEVACAHEEKPTANCAVVLCDVENCVDFETLAKKPHTHTCKCGCDLSKCAECAAAEECKCTAEGDNKHTCGAATCSVEKCADKDCVDNGEIHKRGDHHYKCACVAHELNDKKDAYKACTAETATTNGGFCEDCNGYPHGTSSSPKCLKSETESTECKALEHDPICYFACTKKLGCPATRVHQDGCEQADVDSGAALEGSVTYTFTFPCTCNLVGHIDGKHDADVEYSKGTNDCTKVLEITETVKYTYEKKDKADEQATEKSGKEEAAIEAAKETIAEENETDSWLCDTCKAYKIAKTCDMTADCKAEKGFHNANCLKLCTSDTDCPNDAGNPDAHLVKYYVMEAGKDEPIEKKDTRTEAVAEVNKKIAAKKTARDEAKKTLEAKEKTLSEKTDADDIKAAAADVAAAQTVLELKEKELRDEVAKYTILEVHCKKLGIPDSSTVVSVEEAEAAANTGDDNKTDEVKAPETATDFTDVKEGAWYIPELNAMLAKGIVKGNPVKDKDGKVTGYKFDADEEMNVNYQVVFLSRVLEKGHNTEGAGWADEAKAWATEGGLLEGIEDGKIDRKDVVLVLWRAMGKDEAEQDLSAFEDAAGLEGDHLAAMQWAVSAGIVKGDGDTGTLKTDSVITRAEMIAMLARLDEAK